MEIYLAILIIIVAATLSFAFAKIDVTGAVSGTVIAFFIWLGGGWAGLCALFSFFIAGTTVSKWRWQWKQELKLVQENDGRRSMSHVFANGGVAGACGLLGYLFGDFADLCTYMLFASISVASSDTFSSELGNVYGKKYINILSFKTDRRGLDGVISLEGILFGIAGSTLIGLIYAWFYPGDRFLLIILIGILGNLADSVYGASLQRRGWLNNHQVNSLATLSGALLAWVSFNLS